MILKKRFLFAVICILSILFFVGGPDYYSPRSLKEIWNLGHIVYFALLPLLLAPFPFFQKLRPQIQIASLLIMTILLGTLVEILQYGSARHPDISDIYRDLLGFLVALVFFKPLQTMIQGAPLNLMRTLVTVLVALQCVPAAKALVDESAARAAFPVLSDFQSGFQLDRWSGGAARSLVELPGTERNRAMLVVFSTRKYSGVNLTYFPREWRGYGYLQFRLFNPGPELLNITCRMHDRDHNQEFTDRFNMSFDMRPGWNVVKIELDKVRQAPAGREMHLDRVQGIGIFTTRLREAREAIIDDVKLY
jgi:VanZ family protein